jgi:hypothetical protein
MRLARSLFSLLRCFFASLLRFSGGGFVWDWLGGQEVGLEALGVGVQEFLDAVVAGGFQDEAGVVIFVDAVGDFGIGVRAGVRVFLASQAEDHAGVIVARGWRSVGLLPCAYFQAGPFAPEI